jgi:hypothetical protein
MQRSDDLRNPADRRPAHLDPDSDATDLPGPEDRPDPERGDAIAPDPAHADLPTDPSETDVDAADRPDADSLSSQNGAVPQLDPDAESKTGTDSADGIDEHRATDPDTAIGVAEVPSTSHPTDTATATEPDTAATAGTEPAIAPDGEPPAATTDTQTTDTQTTDTPSAGSPTTYAGGITPTANGATPAETPAAATTTGDTTDDGPMLGTDRSAEFTDRWRELQTSFVDSPSDAVRAADVLVSEVVSALTSALTDRQQALGDEWRDTPDSGTEELRAALMRYRTVFQHLIKI